MDSKGPQYALSNCPELGDQLNRGGQLNWGTSWMGGPVEWENQLKGRPVELRTVIECECELNMYLLQKVPGAPPGLC